MSYYRSPNHNLGTSPYLHNMGSRVEHLEVNNIAHYGDPDDEGMLSDFNNAYQNTSILSYRNDRPEYAQLASEGFQDLPINTTQHPSQPRPSSSYRVTEPTSVMGWERNQSVGQTGIESLEASMNYQSTSLLSSNLEQTNGEMTPLQMWEAEAVTDQPWNALNVGNYPPLDPVANFYAAPSLATDSKNLDPFDCGQTVERSLPMQRCTSESVQEQSWNVLGPVGYQNAPTSNAHCLSSPVSNAATYDPPLSPTSPHDSSAIGCPHSSHGAYRANRKTSNKY
ncbi:MAG: hypothetical protein MMC33_010681 [Icmadophila ericetorum]|nr:hypothetical protein [Icmadophila ericetorum]